MDPIGISTEFIKPGAVGGAEYLVRNLICGLLEVLAPSERLVLFGPPQLFPENRPRMETVPCGLGFDNRFLRESWSFLQHGRSLRAMLFPNYFTPPIGKACRVVTTIFDAQYLHFPQNFSFKKRKWLAAVHRLTLRRADTVVAISEFVKRDLVEKYGRRWESKIVVIPSPVSWERFEQGAPSGSGAPQGRFILSVAAQYPHKNLATLIKAFPEVHRAFPEVKLVLAGQVPEGLIGTTRGVDLRRLVADLGLQDSVLITGHISDRALGALYHAAEVFVFPSLFEGFGLPPVEALGYGIPVITTRCGSLPEVTLGMAHYLDDPLNTGEMAEALLTLLGEPAKYRVPEAGKSRIREMYSPARVARRYYEQLTA